MQPPVLILTLAIETKAAKFFNALRQKNFPPDRNFIDAHLTLFHALPNAKAIENEVEDISKAINSFPINVLEPVSIGKGVAYKLESKELLQLHKKLQGKWFDTLSPQDRQKLWPHITIQNKVQPQQAADLLVSMKNEFSSFSFLAKGLQLWEYLNGPWKLYKQFSFKDVVQSDLCFSNFSKKAWIK